MKKARSTFRRKPFVDETPPIAAIAEEMLSAAFGADLARLAAGEPLVVAVLVPPVWLPHVVDAFVTLAPCFEVAQPPLDARRAAFLEAVCVGEASAAFASRLADLPDPIASVADMIVEIEPPTAAVLRSVVRRLTGVDPGRVPADLGAGLAPEVIAACFRTGTPARRVVARLASLRRAPAAAKEGRTADAGPLLEDLFGYGRAKVWGLSLRDALARMRRGEIRFHDLPAPGAVLSGPPGTNAVPRSEAELGEDVVQKPSGEPIVLDDQSAHDVPSPEASGQIRRCLHQSRLRGNNQPMKVCYRLFRTIKT